MLLTKSDIFSASDIDYKDVVVPQWKGTVRIQTMSIEDQINYERINRSKKEDNEIIFALLMVCCIDENGEKLFTEEDIKSLHKKSSGAILHLFKECLDFNSIDRDGLEKQAKNS